MSSGDLEAIKEWVSTRREAMADLVSQLIEIPTENPPGADLPRCAEVLCSALDDLGFESEAIRVPDRAELDRPQVVRGTIGGGNRLLYFHGHYDVVPAQSPTQFQPRREGGRISGRGSADMKGGIVSMLYGAAAAAELGLLGDGRIVVHLVCDEETGSVAGSGHLLAEGLIDPAAVAMVTPEPTGGVIWHASRGAITMRIDINGREAHVGQAHLGESAFEHLTAIAHPLQELAQRLRSQRTAYALPDDEARGSMLVVGGAAGSGASFNAVPGRAWFSVDRRFNPEEELEVELDRLNRLVQESANARGAAVKVTVLQCEPASATPIDHPISQLLSTCVADVTSRPPHFELCPGVLEIRWYRRLGIPALAYGPGRLDISHGPREYIEEAAMADAASVYARFASRALS